MKDGSGNDKVIGLAKEIGYEITRPRRRGKQSWPLFWIFGFLGSCFFIFAGIYWLMSGIEEIEKDPGMLYCGILFLLLGLGLLAGTIGTFYILVIRGDKKDTGMKERR